MNPSWFKGIMKSKIMQSGCFEFERQNIGLKEMLLESNDIIIKLGVEITNMNEIANLQKADAIAKHEEILSLNSELEILKLEVKTLKDEIIKKELEFNKINPETDKLFQEKRQTNN